ncbi:O-antigen ligase family protein [Labrys wisconsinensis]|uniref:HAMP domain-containing protein n=1 Tax=Labrys wisconsinensis TaxID=425677 RepID=A0ABU0J4Y3_9HYPH|nr:O-antigen ligase family protein [Labrys wisconsinensis]MDQ0469328.1 HAMP domain-containing protein [Labrys wisconsinensis]
MATAAALGAPAAARLRFTVSPERLRQATLWLMVFGGSITMVEPSPYELLGVLAILTWACGGLTLKREMIPVILLVLVYMIGATITLIPVMHLPKTVMWTCIGWFLAFTGLFFMMVLSERTVERLDILVRAYVATAVMCSLIGVLGYARLLPGSDALLLYSRVKSTFQDPNVFGPFLVFPALVLVQRLYIDGMDGAGRNVLKLLIIMAGLFLSFSRGAWGHFVGSAVLMTLMTLWCARSRQLRTRVVVLCILGAVALALLILMLLSFDAVSKLFAERASLEQNYDLGQFGRFNRHWLGFVLALDKPIGIGMLQFGPMFGEDTHNSYLNAFMSYGWIGGIVWPAMVVSTLFVGWKYCLKPAPWRHIFICVTATYQVVVLEAWIIDVDHWRHVWLLFGAVWGLAIATARLQRGDPRSLAETAAPALRRGRRML